jgi:hypothetical protein
MVLAVGAAGALLAYFGFTELMVVAGRAPATESATESAPDATGAPARDEVAATGVRWWRIAGVTAALVVVIGVGATLTTRSARSTASAAGETRCNGYEELCDRRIDEVVFATSHNSMSAARESGWLFGEHLGGIRAQLEYGVRGFLIDTHYGVPSGVSIPGSSAPVVVVTDAGREIGRSQLTEPPSSDRLEQANRMSRETPIGASGLTPDVYLCHNYCELGATRFADALTQYKEFLDRNPNEVLILFLEDYVSTSDSETAFEESGLIDHVWTVDRNAPLPTLGEMIDARRQVLVLSEHLSGPPDWYHQGFDLSEETPYTFKTVDEFTCAPNRGGTSRPLFLMNHWLTSGSPDIDASTRANSYDVLMNRVRACEEERGRRVNMLGVNFYDKGDLLKVVNDLNEVSD